MQFTLSLAALLAMVLPQPPLAMAALLFFAPAHITHGAQQLLYHHQQQPTFIAADDGSCSDPQVGCADLIVMGQWAVRGQIARKWTPGPDSAANC